MTRNRPCSLLGKWRKSSDNLHLVSSVSRNTSMVHQERGLLWDFNKDQIQLSNVKGLTFGKRRRFNSGTQAFVLKMLLEQPQSNYAFVFKKERAGRTFTTEEDSFEVLLKRRKSEFKTALFWRQTNINRILTNQETSPIFYQIPAQEKLPAITECKRPLSR